MPLIKAVLSPEAELEHLELYLGDHSAADATGGALVGCTYKQEVYHLFGVIAGGTTNMMGPHFAATLTNISASDRTAWVWMGKGFCTHTCPHICMLLPCHVSLGGSYLGRQKKGD